MKIILRFFLILICCFTIIIIPTKTQAAISKSPNTTTWVTNGEVDAIANHGTTVYLGGNFSYVGSNTGHGMPVDNVNGTYDSSFPKVNNTINIAVSDGNNGWYIGGTFTQIGSTTRNYLAHILSDGSLDSWNPNPSSQVESLLLDGTTLYVGGEFTSISGVTRNYFAAFDTTTGEETAWNPKANGGCYTMVLSSDKNTLYVGGWFTTFTDSGNTVRTRNRIAALSTSTGVPSAWDPNVGSGTVKALALSSSGTTIFVGGTFTNISAVTRNYVAEINTTTGQETAWDPSANFNVNALALSSSGTTIFVGGTFTNISAATRYRLAEINTTTGQETAWDPNGGVNGYVNSLSLNPTGTEIYAGGSFISLGGAARNNVAVISTSTGLAAAWNPNANGQVKTVALNSDGSKIFIGGLQGSLNGVTRNNIAAIDGTTGLATSWNPNTDNIVRTLAVSPDGNTVYAGGDFSTFTDSGNTVLTRNYIAAIDASTGVPTSWNPNSDYIVRAMVVSSDGNKVYAGGNFSTFTDSGNNVVTRNYIAAIDVSTGVPTSWNPNTNDRVYSLGLSPNNNTVYAGGWFSTFTDSLNNIVTRNSIAAIDASTGIPTSWNPNANNEVDAIITSQDGNTVYAAGWFTRFTDSLSTVRTRNYIAAIDASTGIPTSWNPNADDGVLSLVLSADGNSIYAGGYVNTFTDAGSNIVTRNYIAAIDVGTGIPTSWDPNADSYINAISLSSDGEALYIGGVFGQVDNQSFNNFAQFGTPTAATPTPTPTPASTSNTTTGSSSSSSSTSSTSNSVLSCDDLKPLGTPDLFQIDTNSNFAKLHFTTLKNNVTGYAIAYGFTPNEERYGTILKYSGPKWIIDTTIDRLSPNTTYYFKVKPLNGCNAGNWSNTIKIKTGTGKQSTSFYKNFLARVQSISSNVLGQSTSASSLANEAISDCSYTVLGGDSLWSIAQRKFGSGDKYQQIIDLNPSLSSSFVIHGGQNLILCK